MSLAQDVRFAFRMIRKNPWFSAAIVVTLALGIGVNTTVFSLVNGVLRKPLPFPGGDRLVFVRATTLADGDRTFEMSYSDFRDLREASQAFESLQALNYSTINLTESGNPPERYNGAQVSAGMFDMLHVRPVIGRGLQPADERPGAPQVLLLGHGAWTDRYAQDPSVIGRSVRVNDKPATIIGVMPKGFRFPSNQDAWVAAIPDEANLKRDARRFRLIGVLKEGSSIPEATSALAIVAKRLEQQFPDSHKDHGIVVQTFHQAMNGGQIKQMFLLLLGAVGFVLLIACANVANMLLGRAIGRNREMSIRAALGAGRWRIVRQLLVESVILSLAGGAIGLFLARFGVRAFDSAVSNVGKPYWIDFSIDYTVLLYFAAVSILAGLLFGIAPALRASKVDLNEALKEGGRGSSGRKGGYLTGALVVFQFMLAVVLLSGAGLMIRSFLKAQDEYSYLRPEQILHARVSLPKTRYETIESRQQFFEKLMPALTAIPGASAVALVSNPPGMGAAGWRMELKDQPVAEAQKRPSVSGIATAPNYFKVLGISLLQGRDFTESDGLPGKEVAIVSRDFAARFFPNENPIGKQVRLFEADKPKPWMTIVGVSPSLRQDDPTNSTPAPLLFVPYRSESYSDMAILIRSSGPVATLGTALRRAVQQLDEQLPMYGVNSLEESFARSRWHFRVFGVLFLIFALIALGMAAVGIYAVMANATGQRRREIGVRMALGAEFGDVVRLVLSRGLIQLGIGTVLGVAAAIAVCRLMSRLLFQISPNDPVTLTIVTISLLASGIAACWIPARRAAKLDPLKALHYE